MNGVEKTKERLHARAWWVGFDQWLGWAGWVRGLAECAVGCMLRVAWIPMRVPGVRVWGVCMRWLPYHAHVEDGCSARVTGWL